MTDLARFVLRNLWPLVVIGCASKTAPPDDSASCVGAAPADGLGAYDSTLIAQIQGAELIFQGTVTAVHATTLPESIDTTKTVVARVDRAVFAGPSVAELGTTWSNTLTIDLQTADLTVGQTTLFVTQIEEFNGGQLEVSEITRVDSARYPRFVTDVPAMRQLFAADPLYARIASAAEIVVGGVNGVAAPAGSGGSEHDPRWQVASVGPDDVLCGPAGSAPVAAGFAGSLDLAWTHAPKLAMNQQAVLLLHRAAVPVPFSQNTPELFVVDALDVHPIGDADAIAAILAAPPALP